MKTINRNGIWLPGLLDNLILQGKTDANNNYETFSIPSVNIIEKEQSLKLGAHSYVIKPSSYNGCIEKAKYFNSLCHDEEGKN